MLPSEDAEDRLFKKHKDLCNKLVLDQPTISQAWNSFQNIRNSYNLEGDSLHWLGCAIFVACCKTSTPTLGQTVIEGNGVNLTSLLRYCNLSLQQFFNKIKKWIDMANINEGFCEKINGLERNFAISFNVFKEYCIVFQKIFKPPVDMDDSKHHRNRKQRAIPCNTTKVFEFIWNLFVTLKGKEYMSCSEDLVPSFHLLLACCDLAFQNAFVSDRRDLLNPDFDGLPQNWNSVDFVVPNEAPCIIDSLSGGNNNMAMEAKYMKQYHCKKFITDFFNKGILQGNKDTCNGLFDPGTFDSNFKNIMKLYEHHLLTKGDFDERIFLAEFRRRTLLKEQEQITNASVPSSPQKAEPGENFLADTNKNHEFGELVQQPASTPLTGREYLGPKTHGQVTPLTTTMQSVAKLQTLLNGRQPAPSETLLHLFQSCSEDPTNRIEILIQKLGEKFATTYTQQVSNLPEVQADYANKRLQCGITLFYKLCETILQHESTICKDISFLVQQNIFFECIFACSLEIVMFSYNSQKKFPWILQVLDIEPYNFVKVIEIIVRSKDQFTREVVKHLEVIEETILESMAWKTGSPLWDAITKSGQDIPKIEDIALPGSLTYNESKTLNKSVNMERSSPMQSPGPSAVDRFQSPTAATPVKKQLFPVSKSVIQNTKATHLMVTDEDGKNRLISLADTESEPIQTPAITPTKPKRTGSLAIFFRKFYNLAGVRMDHLCTQLGITDIEFKRKIFTVFEYSIRQTTDLMRDRHLDQLLMCAVYVMCKVHETKQFTEIMRCYRQQPQAASHVYRSVLMRPYNTGDNTSQPTDLQQRNDLINFYNFIYIKVIQDFLIEFTNCLNTQNANALLLSPLPAPRSNLVSPRQQLGNNVFVKPYVSPNMTNGRVFSYCFSRSPSKDLREINKAVNSFSGKRLLNDDDDSDVPNNKRIAKRKVQYLIEDRKNQNVE